jgi:hypothetical protein
MTADLNGSSLLPRRKGMYLMQKAASLLATTSLFLMLPVLPGYADPVTNPLTKPGKWFSFTPSYLAKYELSVIPVDKVCSQKTEPVKLPEGSEFRKPLATSSDDENAFVIDVYQLPEDTNETIKNQIFSTPYKVCLEGPNSEKRSRYRRIGGLSTGILAVPYKFRGNEISSDAAIGPYLGYKFEVVEVIGSLGLSQIAISEIGTEKVDHETGLTAALGISVEVAQDWDFAFLVGVDHLSGDKGKQWEYQDDAWVSVGIGFNFTR